MAFILLVVFAFVLFSKIFHGSITLFTEKVVQILSPQSQHELSLIQQLKDLRKQKSEINMTDEFARYAKCERKITKLTDELKALGAARGASVSRMKLIITILTNVVQVGILLSLVWSYKYESLMQIDPDWLWPGAHFIAFPSGIPGAVGITCWLLVCRNVVNKGQQLFLAG